MNENEISIRVTRLFDDDGNLLAPEDRDQNFISNPIVFEENTAVCKVSCSRDFPMALAKFQNAKVGFHITTPCYMDSIEIENVIKFNTKMADRVIGEQVEHYKEFLVSKGIDMKKIAAEIK